MNTTWTDKGPTSPAHPWSAATTRRPSPWLLLLAIPFWLTVWSLNAPRRTCCPRVQPSPATSDLRYQAYPARAWRGGPVPIPNAHGRYRLHMLGDFPTQRRVRLVMSSPADPVRLLAY
jgi:hypothetical protein